MFSENRRILNQLFTSASAEIKNSLAKTISVSVSDVLVCTERERALITVYQCFSEQFPDITTDEIREKAIKFTSQRKKLITGEEVSSDLDVSSSADQLDISNLSGNLSDTGNTQVLISMKHDINVVGIHNDKRLQYITCYTQGL